LRDPERSFDPIASYVLVLEPELNKVSSHAGLRVDAAIVINLYRIGELDRRDLETELGKIDAGKAKDWLESFAPSESK
jgi:hypothetical protein